MTFARFVESERGARRINPALSANQFAVGRVKISYLVRLASEKILPPNFEYGEDFYRVVTGFSFEPDLAEAIIARARRETMLRNCRDDLSGAGGLQSNDPHYNTYRLAHSLEHLAACDILERGVSLDSNGKGRALAQTAFLVTRLPFARIDIGFYFDKKFANPQEIAISVRNAAKKAASVYTN